MNSTSSRVAAAACLILAAGASLKFGVIQPTPSSAAPAALNYEFFKNKVQPVFLAKRPGHARCVVCHAVNNAPFHLVPLSSGSTTWNDEQSRRNFELVQRVAVAGYLESPLLKHPLAEEAGGDAHHGGGQQFGSKEDPAWLTLKAFVLGETAQ
jgi:hypothetical protein